MMAAAHISASHFTEISLMAAARISQRVGSIAPSATLAVTNKAKALKAAGEAVVGFGAGEPDFPTPDYIVEAAAAACRDPKNHRYGLAGGTLELKAAIAAKTARDSGYEVDPTQVVVTNGGKHAVYNAIAGIVDPGDEVLIPTPFWTTYPEPVKLSGAVYGRDQIEAIGRWALEHGIWVITDEIYEHLTYDGAEFHSIVTLVPELADTCIVLNGVAKTYAMTGWRVGWLIAPPAFAKMASTLQSHQTSNVSNVAQRAALAAVSGPLDVVREMHTSFDRRRQMIFQGLNAIDGVSCMRPQGAFYAYPSFEGLLGRNLGGKVANSTAELADLLLDEIKVALVPGEAFDGPGYCRMAFALGDDDLGEGVQRIADLVARG